MPRLSPDQKNEIASLFSEKHWSCNMIAKKLNFSRAGIKKFLNSSGYDTSKKNARNFSFSCINCGSLKTLPACKARKSKYCSMKCYYEFIKDGDYKPWRHGQRIARMILQPLILSIFGPNQEFVCHHKDGNDENNKNSNLLAFPDQSNHLHYHRKSKIASVLLDMANY